MIVKEIEDKYYEKENLSTRFYRYTSNSWKTAIRI